MAHTLHTPISHNIIVSGECSDPFFVTSLILLDCNNQFVRVDYDPVITIFSCIFENKSDLSPKSCSIIYEQCGQERYTDQGNVTDGSSSVITIKLNSSIVRSML